MFFIELRHSHFQFFIDVSSQIGMENDITYELEQFCLFRLSTYLSDECDRNLTLLIEYLKSIKILHNHKILIFITIAWQSPMFARMTSLNGFLTP